MTTIITRRRRWVIAPLALGALVLGGLALPQPTSANADAAFTLDVSPVGTEGGDVEIGDTIDVAFSATDATDLYAYTTTFAYDADILTYEVDSATTGISGYSSVTTDGSGEDATVTFVHTKMGTSPTAEGEIGLVSLRFTAIAPGTSPVDVTDVEFADSNSQKTSWSSPATSSVTVAPPPAVETSTSVVLSSTKAVYKSGRLTATATVLGTSTGVVSFFDGETSLGNASIKEDGTASRTFTTAVPLGTHTITARLIGTDAALSSEGTARVLITKAKTASVTVSGSAFTKGTQPKVTIKVAQLDNGLYPTGTTYITVNSTKVKTVTMYASDKGVKTVSLPKSSASVKVRVYFLGNPTTLAKTSSIVTIKTK